MEVLSDFFKSIGPIQAAFLATTFTWLMTALGSSTVFFFKKINRGVFDTLLGFTGGVMLAAGFWSLLKPSVDQSEILYPGYAWFPASLGFLGGALFIFFIDKILPHLHINFSEYESEGLETNWKRSTLLLFAITLHNIPEGLAIGVLFGLASSGGDIAMANAIALAIGIGIQNIPEGMAVSFPLRRNGLSRWKSFHYGQLSAIVEPLGGVIGAVAVVYMQGILPYALAFAAGAMIFVVVEEVIPETQRDKYTDLAALGFIAGFCLMMILDIGLS